MVIVAVCLASVALIALIVWTGTRMVAHPDPDATSVGGALGTGLGVFDPGSARAADDLAEQKNQTEVVPTPSEHDPGWKLDLHRGTVRIPRPE